LSSMKRSRSRSRSVRLSSIKRKHQLTQELWEGQRQKLQRPLKTKGHVIDYVADRCH
jgi:hypothetical protein